MWSKSMRHVKRESTAHAGADEDERPRGHGSSCRELRHGVDPVEISHGAPIGDDGVAVSRQVRSERFCPKALSQGSEGRQHSAVASAAVQDDHGRGWIGQPGVAVHMERRSTRQLNPAIRWVYQGRGEVGRRPSRIPPNMRIVHVRSLVDTLGAVQGPMRTPQQERSRRRVAALLDAASEEFAERGFTAATTTGVAARAGVPIGSLYQWFPDKDALLYGLADRHLTEGSATMLHALDRARAAVDLESSVRVLVEATVEANSGDPRVHRILYREAPRPAELQDRLSALEDALTDWVADELRRRRIARRPKATLRARTLVLAIEALVHDLVLDPPPGITRAAAVSEVVAAAVAIAKA
jgi:AcrR family transcriptional regulator